MIELWRGSQQPRPSRRCHSPGWGQAAEPGPEPRRPTPLVGCRQPNWAAATRHCLALSAKTSFPERKEHFTALRAPFRPKPKTTRPRRAAPTGEDRPPSWLGPPPVASAGPLCRLPGGGWRSRRCLPHHGRRAATRRVAAALRIRLIYENLTIAPWRGDNYGMAARIRGLRNIP